MALFTYQVLHFTWLKLESIEEKEEKTAELEGLEGELRAVAKGVKKS
jgi:DNA polymerase III delta prime subunit